MARYLVFAVLLGMVGELDAKPGKGTVEGEDD